MDRALLLLCLLPFIAPAAASAQDLPAPPARVRLSTPSLERKPAVATLLAIRGDTMLVQLDDSADSTALAVSSLTSLEVSAGRHRPIAKGLGIGLLSGAAFGLLVGAASGDDPGGFISFSAEEKAAIGAVVFGGLGAIVGGVIGASRQTERWQSVALARARPVIGPLPDGRGIEIAVIVRF